MNRLKRVCWWFGMNGVAVWLSVLGVQGNVGAGRVAILLIWFGIIASFLFLALLPEKEKIRIKEKGRSVPAFLSVIVDLFLIFLFVWHGWWMTGIGCILSCLFEFAIYHKEDKEKS